MRKLFLVVLASTLAAVAHPAFASLAQDGPIGPRFPWWILIAGGGGIFVIGLLLWFQIAGDPCTELFDKWQELRRDSDDEEGVARARRAYDECVERRAGRNTSETPT